MVKKTRKRRRKRVVKKKENHESFVEAYRIVVPAFFEGNCVGCRIYCRTRKDSSGESVRVVCRHRTAASLIDELTVVHHKLADVDRLVEVEEKREAKISMSKRRKGDVYVKRDLSGLVEESRVLGERKGLLEADLALGYQCLGVLVGEGGGQ